MISRNREIIAPARHRKAGKLKTEEESVHTLFSLIRLAEQFH
jgi:hypothetical protein